MRSFPRDLLRRLGHFVFVGGRSEFPMAGSILGRVQEFGFAAVNATVWRSILPPVRRIEWVVGRRAVRLYEGC